jgi:hypothetical protein
VPTTVAGFPGIPAKLKWPAAPVGNSGSGPICPLPPATSGSEIEGSAAGGLCAAIKAPRVCDDSGEEQLPEEQAVAVLSGGATSLVGSNELAVVRLVVPDWAVNEDCRTSHIDEAAPRANIICLNSNSSRAMRRMNWRQEFSKHRAN